MIIKNPWKGQDFEVGEPIYVKGEYRIYKLFDKAYLHTREIGDKVKRVGAIACLAGANKRLVNELSDGRLPRSGDANRALFIRAKENEFKFTGDQTPEITKEIEDRFFLEEIIFRFQEYLQFGMETLQSWDMIPQYPKQLLTDWMREKIEQNPLTEWERYLVVKKLQGDQWPDFYFQREEDIKGLLE